MIIHYVVDDRHIVEDAPYQRASVYARLLLIRATLS